CRLRGLDECTRFTMKWWMFIDGFELRRYRQEVAEVQEFVVSRAEGNDDGINVDDARRLVENMENSITEGTQIYGELEEGNEYGNVSHHLHQPPPLFFPNQFASPLAYHQIHTTIPVHIPPPVHISLNTS
ncbi:hypothetical protein MKW98_028431, partial [Papaver atlanticum]